MYNVPFSRGCVGVRIGTLPALIAEGDYQGHPLESRGITIGREGKSRSRVERIPRSLHVTDPPAEFIKRRPLGPCLG